MKKLLYDSFEVREVVEYPSPMPNPDSVGGRPVWHSKPVPPDDSLPEPPGAQFLWAVYGHRPDGHVLPLMTGPNREDLITLCIFLNTLVAQAKTADAPATEPAAPATVYGLSVYLEKGSSEATLEIDQGITYFYTTDPQEAERAMQYADEILTAGFNYLNLLGKSTEETESI